MSTMIKILVVVPYDELYQQVESYVGTLDEPELTIDLHHIVGTGSQELQAIVDRGYDIVVARGITARALALRCQLACRRGYRSRPAIW
jgi:hypothetical protein